MKQCVGEKSIAWFRLAECISRGEKERALNLYRLLTHSLHDPAFIKKLEADIIATFDLALAAKEYLQAATLYCQQKDIKEALLIYQLAFDLLLQHAHISHVVFALEQLKEQQYVGLADYAKLTDAVVCKTLLYNLSDKVFIQKYIDQTVLAYTQLNLDYELQKFLTYLQLLEKV